MVLSNIHEFLTFSFDDALIFVDKFGFALSYAQQNQNNNTNVRDLEKEQISEVLTKYGEK